MIVGKDYNGEPLYIGDKLILVSPDSNLLDVRFSLFEIRTKDIEPLINVPFVYCLGYLNNAKTLKEAVDMVKRNEYKETYGHYVITVFRLRWYKISE